MNALNMLRDVIGSLTGIVVSLVGLGVAAGVVFGEVAFVGDVLGNLLALVNTLGGERIVGLVVSTFLLDLYR